MTSASLRCPRGVDGWGSVSISKTTDGSKRRNRSTISRSCWESGDPGGTHPAVRRRTNHGLAQAGARLRRRLRSRLWAPSPTLRPTSIRVAWQRQRLVPVVGAAVGVGNFSSTIDVFDLSNQTAPGATYGLAVGISVTVTPAGGPTDGSSPATATPTITPTSRATPSFNQHTHVAPRPARPPVPRPRPTRPHRLRLSPRSCGTAGHPREWAGK